MPKTMLDQLWSSSKEVKTSKEKGHGIGLMAVKRIVEDHKGSVEVTSKVGMGTTFVFTFPTIKPPT